MGAKQLATWIDEKVKAALDEFCEQRGYKIGKFVEDAILDKLEEHEDQSDVKSLRKEKTRALEDVIKDLKKSGKL